MNPQRPGSVDLSPALALDDCGYEVFENFDEIVCLLHWVQDPKAACGKDFFVPDGHPSGLGGRHIRVPWDFITRAAYERAVRQSA